MARVGVLALQGGFAAHCQVLADRGHEPVEIRTREQLERLEGLVLPGGESTVQVKLLERFALADPVDAFVRSGRPVLATCAGLILAAREVSHPTQRSFGWIDVSVTRNGWGRQLDSAEAVADDGVLPLVLIRAPRIVAVGRDVEVLATLQGEPVLVRQGNVTGTTFHPELAEDRSIHHGVFG